LIAVATEGDQDVAAICQDLIEIPMVDEVFTPFLTVIPLQLYAYYVADLKGTDVDQPRNLAKTVTVE
jgi:glucosamine--fructose-6-phosphate aminotransferase (isomerizing)